MAREISGLASQNGRFISLDDIPLHGLNAEGRGNISFPIYKGIFYYDEFNDILWTSGFKSKYKILTAWNASTGEAIKTFPDIGDAYGFIHDNESGYFGVISGGDNQSLHIIQSDTLEVISSLKTDAKTTLAFYTVEKDTAWIIEDTAPVFKFCTISIETCHFYPKLWFGTPTIDQFKHNTISIYAVFGDYIGINNNQFFKNIGSSFGTPEVPCGENCNDSIISRNYQYIAFPNQGQFRFGKIEANKKVDDYFLATYNYDSPDKRTYYFKYENPSVPHIKFSPDGRLVTFTYPTLLVTYSTNNGAVINSVDISFEDNSEYSSIFYSQDSSLTAFPKFDGSGAKIIDTLSGKYLADISYHASVFKDFEVNRLGVLHFDNNQYLALSMGRGMDGASIKKSSRVSFPAGTYRSPGKEFHSGGNTVAGWQGMYIESPLSLLAYQTKGGLVKIFDIENKKFYPFCHGMTESVIGLQFSETSEYLIAWGVYNIYAWEIATGDLIYKSHVPTQGLIDQVNVIGESLYIEMKDQEGKLDFYNGETVRIDLSTKEETIYLTHRNNEADASALKSFSTLSGLSNQRFNIFGKELVDRNYLLYSYGYEGDSHWLVKAGVILNIPNRPEDSEEELFITFTLPDGIYKNIQLLDPNLVSWSTNRSQTRLVLSFKEETPSGSNDYSKIYSLPDGQLLSSIDKYVDRISEDGNYVYHLDELYGFSNYGDWNRVKVYDSKTGELVYKYFDRSIEGVFVYDKGHVLISYDDSSYLTMPLDLFSEEDMIQYYRDLSIRDFTEKERERLFLD